MTPLNTLTVLVIAYLAVFFEAYFRGLRSLIGAQIDLLPALMVCTGFRNNLSTVGATAIVSGLWFDSLSANPLGISILPLFLVGAAVHHWRDLILREQRRAQVLMGLAASAAAPLLTVLLLLTLGIEPLVDAWSIWRWLIMAMGVAIATPVFITLFDMIQRAFNYQPQRTTAFRPDREIKHGPHPHSKT
jgi:cell shape-determining protein MreD